MNLLSLAVVQTMRLADLFKETAQQSEIASQADPHAGWPGNVGCGLFDIATVCVRRRDRDRPTMDQVCSSQILLCTKILFYWV